MKTIVLKKLPRNFEKSTIERRLTNSERLACQRHFPYHAWGTGIDKEGRLLLSRGTAEIHNIPTHFITEKELKTISR